MNVNEAVRNARALLAVHGLTDWHIKLDNAKQRNGQCRYSIKTISLSRYGIEFRTAEQTRDTVLHEIAHALTPGHHHDAVWRRKCIEIGGNGQRCNEGAAVPFRYVGTCPGCSSTRGRHKLSKAITTGASCGSCSGSVFNPRYALKWVDTQTGRAIDKVAATR